MEDQKAPYITQYSKDNWPIYKTMVQAYADVIDAAEFLTGLASPPEDAAAKVVWNKKKANLRFQLLRSLGNNSTYINGLKTDHPYELWKKLMDTHESTTEASANQMLRDVMNMRKEADESVRDCISRIQHKLNRLDALLSERNIDLSALLRKNRMLEIIGVDYPALREQLFLVEGLSTEQLEARILEGTERLDFERAQDTYRVSQVGYSDPGSNDNKYCPYCLKHKNKRLTHKESNCYAKHPEKRPKDDDNTKKDVPKGPQKPNPKSKTSLRKANQLLKKTLADHNIKIGADGTTSQAWLACTKITSRVSAAAALHSDDSIIFDVDTGAENHYIPTSEAHKLDHYSTDHTGHTVVCANNTEDQTRGCGSIQGKLPKVYAMDNFQHALLSVPTLIKDQKAALFHPEYGVVIANATDFDVRYKNPLLLGNLQHGMFQVKMRTSSKPSKTYAQIASLPKSQVHSPATPVNDLDPKHIAKAGLTLERLGYPSPDRVMLLAKDPAYGLGLPSNLSKEAFRVAENDVYQLGKSHKQPNRNLHMKVTATRPWELIHIDISYIEPNYKGERYQLTATCDYSGAVLTKTLKTRDLLVPCLKRWHSQVIQPQGHKISYVRADNAGESTSVAYDDFLTEIAAGPQYTSRYSKGGTAVAERANQTLATIVRCLKLAGNFPDRAVSELYDTAAHLHNRLPHGRTGNEKTPYELIHNKKPNLSYLRAIGCTAYVHQPGEIRPKKHSPRARKGTLIGYNTSQNSKYRILMDYKTGEIIETKDVTFAETVPNLRGIVHSMPGLNGDHWFAPDQLQLPSTDLAPVVSTSASDSTDSDAATVMSDDPDSTADGTAPGRPLDDHTIPADDTIIITQDNIDDFLDEPLQLQSKRTRTQVDKFTYPTTYIQSRAGNKSRRSTVNSVRMVRHAARGHAFSAKYEAAVRDPIIAASMRTELVDLLIPQDDNRGSKVSIVRPPAGAHIITNTWATKKKYDTSGNFDRAKSRVCPHGFRQIPHVDFDPDATEAPTLAIEHGMFLLQLQVIRDMKCAQVDFKSAFQNTDLEGFDIYMKPPKGLQLPDGYVLKLHRTLQGTKQAAHDFHYHKVDKLLTEYGLASNPIEPCIYSKWVSNEVLLLVGVYVDDFRIISDSQDEVDKLKVYLAPHGAVEVDPNKWLGLTINHDVIAGTLSISNEFNIVTALNDFGLTDCKPMSTPAAPGTKLYKTVPSDDVSENSTFPYQSAVGILRWFSRTTHPQILYAVNQCAQHNVSPNNTHITAAKRIFRYLQGTKSKGLIFRRGDGTLTLKAFCDADFGGEPEGNDQPMRSTTGLLVYLHGVGPLYWKSQLQTVTATSTKESEYYSAGACARVLVGFRQLCHALGFSQDSSEIQSDNQPALYSLKTRLSHSKSRHIKIQFHYVKDLIRDEEVHFKYCPTEDMVADLFTKALPASHFERLTGILYDQL